MPWRRAWQPTPVLLTGESHGQRSLVGYTVHRITKSWTQLKRPSTHAHTLENTGKSTLGNLPRITSKPNIHAKTNVNVHNRQKGNQKCINWQVNTKQNMLYLNKTKYTFYTIDGLQNLRWNHKTPEGYILCDYTNMNCPTKTNVQMQKAGQWLSDSGGKEGLE